MTRAEWESLCDGCGLCCLHKLHDEDGRVFYSNVACRLLDPGKCRCTNYAQRKDLVPDCVILTPKRVAVMDFLPATCAYRLVHEGKNLKPWHPLRSNDPDSVHKAGISARGRSVPERRAGDIGQHLIDWVRQSGRKKN